MDAYTLFPYWFIIVLLIVNAIAVGRIEIDIEDEHPSNEQHD
ncbi:hypothetical protein [Flavilitoribacter nigricans]|nr:hypothetical protein [Flavilitoribacter nigricans]